MEIMQETRKILLATKYSEKGYDFETCLYGDDLYEYENPEKSEIMDDIWDYVIEYKEIGSIAFKEKYREKYKNFEGTLFY